MRCTEPFGELRVFQTESMSSYNASPDAPAKTKAIAGVLAVHIALAAVILSGLNVETVRNAVERMQTISVFEPEPPPPPPPPQPKPEAARKEAGAPGRQAEPSPIVAPAQKIPVPSPIVAAKVAGQGSAATSGAASAGNGTGAGGTGAGTGGGGSGLSSAPRLISGGPNKQDYHRLGARVQGGVRPVIRLGVSSRGRVASCTLVQSSGYPEIDARLCSLLGPRMVWAPARDRNGQPVETWFDFVVPITRI